mgnify:CR=1 FL=1
MAALVERVGSAIERAYAYPDSGRVVDEAVEAVRRTILDLSKEAYVKEPNELKLQLKKAIPEYHPYLT